ncbi:MAG: 2-isopropylmalate synthase [Firmicutes bacterium ADurb.Bin248]|nr:MAG: 2-isopropylmalate synthase [Firmicutes bacterium ADurb.Bin248]HOG00897.1 alpha-isopropylmalate synthase regulatory domain-containing protein [Clostridia bacterium]HPK16033.1 alpha-isopropylmalate synthase regulatory domain-containing protein [Clostridia bacterium]
MENLFISDVTLRQDLKRAEAALSFREKLEIARALDRLRLHGVELPPMQNEKADALLIKSIASAVKESRLVLPAALSKEGIEAAWSAIRGAARPCIQIALPASAAQMEYVCHKKPEQMLQWIGELVGAAKALCPEAEFVAEDATRSEPEFLRRALETAALAGADTLTLCDSSDGMLPIEFGGFVKDAVSGVPALAGKLIGVQCTDQLRLAAACALAATGSGARLVKAACGDEGLLPLENFAAILRARGMDMGFRSDIAMTELTRAAAQIRWILNAKRTAAAPYGNSAPRRADEALRLSGASALPEVIAAVHRLGYDLSEEDNAKVYDAFHRIADKKDVGEKELDAIVASVALQVPPTYAVGSYVINSGNVITATAHIKLIKQWKTLSGFGTGDGPIDAAFLALEQIVGHHYELDDFQIQAVTEGREAMGAALVRLRADNRLYSGRGISTDIIGASIHAYLNALNKIVYEEGGRA